MAIARTRLPIATPCTQADALVSNDRGALYCEQCDAPVHDLSAMTELEARVFLNGLQGKPKPCMRYAVDRSGDIRFRSAARTGASPLAMAAGAVAMLVPSVAAAEPSPAEPAQAQQNEATAAPHDDAASTQNEDSSEGCPLPQGPGEEILGGAPPDDDDYYAFPLTRRERRHFRREKRRARRAMRRWVRGGKKGPRPRQPSEHVA